MTSDRRRFLSSLLGVPAAVALARLGIAADAPPRKPRKARVLSAPIHLKSGDRLENLDLTLAPDFRWERNYAVIFGADIENVTVRNVRITGPTQWQKRWNDWVEPRDAPPTGIHSQLCGIRLQRVKHVTLEQLAIEGLPRYAITGFGYEDCVIRDIDITRCVVGVTIKHFEPSHRLLVERVRVHDTWAASPENWPNRANIASKVRPGTFVGGDAVVLDTARDSILRDCEAWGEHFGSFKLVNPVDVEVSNMKGMALMVQGTGDLDWKIHKKPARGIRIHDCVFDKARGTGRIREKGNMLQISWHVRDLDIRRCQLRADGQGGHGIQLAVDSQANVVDCTFDGFNGTRGGEPCYAADVWKDCKLNDDFVERNTFVNQHRKVWRRKL